MKNFVSKRAVSALIAGMMITAPVTPMISQTVISVSAAKMMTTSPSHTQEIGWYNEYHHEIWQADTPNSSTMTLHENDGGFSAQWKCGPDNSGGNFIANRGFRWGLNNPYTYKDYSDFYCDYDCSWVSGSTGNAKIGIYGWAQNPLVEYYIIEDWKNWSPAQAVSAQYKGSVNIDGSQYKVYTINRNSDTIEGKRNFTQYISIRQNTRTKGTISVSEHFKAWENLGMKMGNLYEISFSVEGWECDGQADVSMNMYQKGICDCGHHEKHPVQNINMEYNSQYKQMRLTWDAVDGADSYGIAVYLAGKWRVQEENITDTVYTSPKNLTPGKTYKVAIAAKVNGKWDTANAIKNAVSVTIK